MLLIRHTENFFTQIFISYIFACNGHPDSFLYLLFFNAGYCFPNLRLKLFILEGDFKYLLGGYFANDVPMYNLISILVIFNQFAVSLLIDYPTR